ncbi:amidohydrolase [Nitriliruptor alkaliphilus]|uniref:amidohydrolase n=1 Tax=Nitriliruptor alkaliphilus TaxID=427918 RepID=UPI000B298DCD|nr:amidohydrolase family protein [Nitriliruptor alkaliphilus]
MSGITTGDGDAASLVLEGARLPGAAEPSTIVVIGGVIASVDGEPPSDAVAPQRVDLAGRTVIPGLWDTHVHAEQWAVARRRLDLRGAASARDAADLVAAAAVALGPGEALIGVGMRDALWPDAPDKDLLEAVAPGRVVAIQGNDLHTAWLSPAALVRVGAGDHETGVLKERACYQAMGALQEHDEDAIDGWVTEALTAAAARGVTGLIDFEMGDCLPAWQRRAERGRLDVRIECTVYREHLRAAIARGMPSGTIVHATSGMVAVGPLKLFVDGSLNSRTALCHEPYPEVAGDDGAHGLLETPPDLLQELMREAAAHRIDSAVHAIGDRATALALDAFEAVGTAGRIEHAQLIARDDVPRFARPGLVVGVQPAHLVDDRDVADRHWLGRTDRTFPFADLLAAGATIEFGSDAPVAPLDPWVAISAAVTRTGDDRAPWHPEQRIGVADALAASSRGRTRLTAADPADLVVLDHDPLDLEGSQLTDPGVVGTLCAGRWTHRTF